MQASLSATRVAAGPRPFATQQQRRRTAVPVRAVAEEETPITRRHLAGLLAAVPALLPARRALADLIPDDDDEELVEKAKANRKAKLAAERAAQRDFARSASYSTRSLDKELIPVQKAINGLAATGAALEGGDVRAAASALEGTSGLAGAAETLSYNDETRESADAMLSSLASLEAAAKGGKLADAKRSYVASVAALQQWANAAGIASNVKGL